MFAGNAKYQNALSDQTDHADLQMKEAARLSRTGYFPC
ncbi:hypothetical protein APS_2542 [Acetobacter pasteurianus subsp. pasteurianus LMG 1262 = NBRC 106471]|nr:hypothetical protein APS_2542 [Acetobacter pasteurianus subsp. pasteurianus LMG 1262 = NBRC 106471]